MGYLIATLSLIFSLYAGSVAAGVGEDANSLFDWAESAYPALFSPAGAATQQLDPWIFRYYANSQTYAGVNTASGAVYVLGDAFGGLVYVAPLQDLLPIIDGQGAGGNGAAPGGCVDIPTSQSWASGTRIVNKVVSGAAAGTVHDASYTITNVSPTSWCWVQMTTTTNSFGTSQAGDEQCQHVANGNLYIDSLTFLNPDGTRMPVEYASPGLLAGPTRACQGASWDSGPASYTAILSLGGFSTTVSGATRSRGTVEAVTEQITTPAGTFNTVRFRGSISDVSEPEQVVVAWFDTNTGVTVRQEMYDASGRLSETWEVIQMNID